MERRKNTKRARSLRKIANTPEQIAWEALRQLRKQGFPVRRQHPIGKFIADFAIVKEKLVIEIDGGIHALPEVAERDMKREQMLVSNGWRVLRIPAETAMSKDHLFALVQKELNL